MIAVEGDLDLVSAPKLRCALLDRLEAGERRIVLDLSLVTFMDSTALGVLVGVNRRMSPHGILVMSGAQPSVLRLLEMTGLDRALDFLPTLDAGLAHVRQAPLRIPAQLSGSDARSVTRESRTSERIQEADDFGNREGPGVGIPLTSDAAVVLGLAFTAIPFARSTQAQVTRWLRVLRQYGESGITLMSLGIADEELDPSPEQVPEQGQPAAPNGDRNAVATVAGLARRAAGERGASAVCSTDFLRAVMEFYGSDFEHVLLKYGLTSDDVAEALGCSRSASDSLRHGSAQ